MRPVARALLASSLLAAVACGGANAKPAETESSDTASLDPKSSATESSAGAGSGSSSAGNGAAASGASGASPGASTGASAGSTSQAATSQDSAAAAAPGASHPVPAATGSIDGKPFNPKLAQITGRMQKDGRLAVVLHEGSDCVAAGDAKPGDASMTLMVTWKDGYKVDLGSLQRAKGGSLGEAGFVRLGDGKKRSVSTTFKPTGLVTIVAAPTQKDAVGKMKIDLQSGDYMLAGDLDVKVCVAPK
jgi:hypothetical protein